ncbi:MAG: hypothetical protein U9P50_02895 [Patescibacteria group bacterium]|nr:hypothetical protein [Patescibacteria group bacterium]
MKKVSNLKSLILISFFLATNIANAQTNFNAGFVDGLWYSKTPFFAGEEIRIYTVIQNQSGFDIIGTVKFFNDDKLLSQSDFSIVDGRLIEKWADWKPSQGQHDISVKLSNTKKIEIGKNPEPIELAAYTSIVETHEIDLDTDGDGVGNKDDLDDDNDGISDIEEKEAGTNSLVFDKPVVVEEEEGDTKGTKDYQTKDNEDNTFFDNLIEKSKELADLATEKTVVVVEDTKKFLEKQKDKVDEELVQAKKEAALKDTPKIDEDKNPYVASLVGSIPELKEVYRFFLATLIYILNSWWILLGTILILFYFIWKILKRGFRRRY